MISISGKYTQFVTVEDLRQKARKPLSQLVALENMGIKVIENFSDDTPQTDSSKADVFLIPLNQINTAKDLFQNRKKDFSERSTNRIIQAVKDGSFDWPVFDPVLLWFNPQDGKLYILSGHSRTQAFKVLSAEGTVYKNRSFDRIPAKVIKTDFERARQIALESNTLQDKETDLERALFYRNMRLEGANKSQVLDKAKELEGKEALKIISFSYLNPNGKVFQALEQFDSADQTSKNNLQNIASYIGKVREAFPVLTDAHEGEMFDWLLNGGYGNKAGQISRYDQFKNRIYQVIQKNTVFGEFEQDRPLNIQRNIYKDPVQIEHEKRIAEAQKNLKLAIASRDAKFKELEQRGATQEQFTDIMPQYDGNVRGYQKELLRLLQQQQAVDQAARQQTALFGINGILGFNLYESITRLQNSLEVKNRISGVVNINPVFAIVGLVGAYFFIKKMF